MRRYSLAAALLLAPLSVSANEPAAIPHWDLDSQYPTDAAWAAAVKTVQDALASLEAHDGRHIRGPDELANLLDESRSARGSAGNLARVALLQASIDTSSVLARSRQQAASGLEADVERGVGWIDRAVLELGAARVKSWLAREPRLARHQRRLSGIFRQAPHAGAPGSQPLMAALERAAALPLDLYRELMAADLGWPKIAVRQQDVTVDFLSYPRLKRDADRATREQANRVFLLGLKRLELPLGLLLVRRFEMESALARSRSYPNGIDAFFSSADAIPAGTYRRIYRVARANRETAARYLRLVGRLNGVAEPGIGDLNAPPPAMRTDIPAGEVVEQVISAWAPIGLQYQELIRRRLREPWMDLAPSPHKDSSAGGVYWQVGGGHPYLMLSFANDFPSSEALAAAAALLMFYADLPADKLPERRDDDFPVYSNAVWFLGELLYDDYLLGHVQGRRDRIGILASKLFRMWNAYFQFALTTELEDEISTSVSSNAPMSGPEISGRYLSLLEAYYGSAGSKIDPVYAAQWMTYPFLFDSRHILPEWALAMAAGASLTRRLLVRDPRVIAVLRSPLSSPRSYDSNDLLLEAGVNLDSDEPYLDLIRQMNGDMDLAERELSSL